MEKEFVPYELSLKLKELGFDSPCFGYYESQDKNLVINYSNIPLTEEQEKRKGLYLIDNRNSVIPQWAVCAPTFSQAFEWFRETHYIFSEISVDCTTYPKFCYTFNKFFGNPNDLTSKEWGWEIQIDGYSLLCRSHREAELDCLEKLIQFIK